jgi:hypothetical protein
MYLPQQFDVLYVQLQTGRYSDITLSKGANKQSTNAKHTNINIICIWVQRATQLGQLTPGDQNSSLHTEQLSVPQQQTVLAEQHPSDRKAADRTYQSHVHVIRC